MQLLHLLGRFHVVVLHLPIGFLFLAFLMELANRLRRSSDTSIPLPTIRFSLFWGMVTAIIASVFGYLLSREGGYDEALLTKHQWLGFTTAGLSALLYYVNREKENRQIFTKAYFPLFVLTVLILTLTGHFGGSLTHGSGYLFEKVKIEDGQPVIANLDSAEVFIGVIQPILKSKCGNCHNPSKKKGELVLLSKDDILKGGENGQVLFVDQPSESPILKAINLPHGDDGHMPPEGKKQLSTLEKQILGWWINAGAPFDKKVGESGMPSELRVALLEQINKKASPLESVKIEPVSESLINKLREEGIPVQPIAENSPFLHVSLSDRNDLSPDLLNKLKKIAKNITVLDLGNSNIDDQQLAIIKGFPHINRLYLDQTAVTGKGMAYVAGLEFLEYLNLYGTKVSDEGIRSLEGLKNLKSLYLWQTEVSEQGLAKFTSLLPDVTLNKGIENDSIFGEVALKAPAIEASKDLFNDTVHLVLKTGFGKASIHYTLDGTDPDSTSAVYENPIVLDASAELKAISIKSGWNSSEITSKQFFKIKYQPQKVVLAAPPDPKYTGEGGKSLADFKKGTLNFGQGGWIAYQGQHLTATLDMGKAVEITAVTVSTLENTGSWIFFPKGIRLSVSLDGKTYKKVKETNYPVATDMTQPSLRSLHEKVSPVRARFVKAEVLSNLKNPKWHPSAGKPCWVFVDEILVE